MGKPGRPHLSQEKSSWLLDDARQMEKRLADVRSQMEKEHRERQRRLAAGRVWTSSDAPRTRISMQQISGRGNVTLESSLSQAAVKRVTLLGSQTQSRGGLPPSSHVVEHDDKPSKEESRSPKRSSDTHMHSNSVNKESMSLANGQFDEEDSRQSFLAALDAWRGTPKVVHANQTNAVDTAVVTDTHPVLNGHGPDVSGHVSVFQRMLLLRAMEKAGNAAAAVCQCRHAHRVLHQRGEDVAAPSSFSVGCEMHLDSGDPAVSRPRASAQAKCGTTVDTSMFTGPCPDDIQHEDVVVISVTDADPHQALTSKSRLPDTIVLPHE